MLTVSASWPLTISREHPRSPSEKSYLTFQPTAPNLRRSNRTAGVAPCLLLWRHAGAILGSWHRAQAPEQSIQGAKVATSETCAQHKAQNKAQHHAPAWQNVAAKRRLRQASGWAGHPSSLLDVNPVYARSRVARTPCRYQPQIPVNAAQGCSRQACADAWCLCRVLCTLYIGLKGIRPQPQIS